MLALDFNVASLEPFDGYSWRAASWITSSLLFGSLIFSAFVPMGYCRYGCPTGKLLNFVRFRHRGEKFGSKEIVGTAFLLVGLSLFLLRHYLI